jgi:hypothetical protein
MLIRTVVLSVISALLASSAAAVPAVVPYLGYLSFDSGAPYDGVVDVSVGIYTDQTSGTLLFSQEFDGTPVNGGMFSLLLGSGGSSGVLDTAWMASDSLWLQFTIGTTPMSGRQQVLAVPFARVAADAEKLGGLEPSAYLLAGGDAGLGVVTASALASASGVKLGNDSAACDANKAGTIRWTGTEFQGCDGQQWAGFSAQSAIGTSPSSPGLSCLTILNQNASAPNGVYWLDPNGGSTADAFEAYCDMTSTPGGWTLVLKTAPDSTLAYSSALWTDANTLNPLDLTTASGNAKYPAFGSVVGNNLRGCAGASSNCVTYSIASTTARALFSGSAATNGPGRSPFVAVFGFEDSSQPHCNQSGINVASSGSFSKARFGVLGNNENDCGSTDSAWGFGLSRYASSCGAGAITWDGGEPETGHCQHATLWVR